MHRYFLSTWTALVLLLLTPGSSTAESQPEPSALRIHADGWDIDFQAGSGELAGRNPSCGVEFRGALSFAVETDGHRDAWHFEKSRDYATNRIALVDRQNNVQGYLTLSVDSARLRLNLLQRPPQQFSGLLEYRIETVLGPHSFACRTLIPDDSPVVQMASGTADSALNESIFDPDHDLALRFTGRNIQVSTHRQTNSGPRAFTVILTASTAHNDTLGIELLPHYYQSRYVPDYHCIDRSRAPSAPTGWMSWNAYFDTAGEKENLDEARLGARFLKPFGLEIWSIESWQDNSPKLPVSEFYNLTLHPSPEKFPHGMKWLAEQIRQLGFRPGIWTVPFGTGDSNYYAAHKAWFLHDPQGRPMQNWCGRYLLDPSQEAVLKQMEDSHRTMSADWGYEFFKIDGMSGRDPGYSAHFFERPEVRAAFRGTVPDPYGRSLEALRRGIGRDRIFLACQGHYSGPETGVADAARLGSDIVAPNQPPHWENYLNQARVSQAQLFTHNIIWYNDPDTLMVAEPTSLDTVRLAATVIALPGQLTFFGDKLGGLSPERMRLLQQTLPVCDARPLDLAPNHLLRPIWDLKVQRPFDNWDVVSLFNWDEKTREQTVEFSQLGLASQRGYLVFDFWNHTFLGLQQGRFALPVPARGNRLIAIHESADHPQFLSTDRHVTQGAVEWRDSNWNADARKLTTRFQLVENDSMTVYFHVPEGYIFDKASAEGAEITSTSSQAKPLLSITLRRPTTGEARLILKFQTDGKK